MSLMSSAASPCGFFFFESQPPNAPRSGVMASRAQDAKISATFRCKVRRQIELGTQISTSEQNGDSNIARIREQLVQRAEQPSSYDTAWVAMVPAAPRGASSSSSSGAPRFPRCVEWILENQRRDGSWGLDAVGAHPAAPQRPALGKDALSSTLACVLALRTWGVGDEHVRKGLRFIGSNSSYATDDTCDTPVGFNVVFAGMVGFGMDMGLELPLSQTDVEAILRLRDTELKRDGGGTASARKAFMAYVSEGLGNLQDWEQVMAYQRKNGSLFDSPSATAAAAIHIRNDRALDYLDEIATKFGGSVPTVYPRNVYSQLCMVDTLEKMGVSLNFASEIKQILGMTYRSWVHNEEEVMLDMATCAMAFRLLRMHGYDITSDGMAQFSEESSFHDSIEGYLNDTKTLLQLYKASQVRFSEKDLILENIGHWSGSLLKQQLCFKNTSRTVLPQEVEYTLKFPLHATLERLKHKRNIEQFQTEGFHLLKSAYCASRANDEILALAVNEFQSSQTVYQQEFQFLKSWVEEVRLDELKFSRARLMTLHTLFTAASTMFHCDLSDTRITWSQNCLLTTAIDDFFDIVGSREEMENLVALIEKWDAHAEIGFCSETVEILFYAIYNTNKQIGAKAALVQNRDVDDHIAELWLDAARAMMTETVWRRNKYVPATMEEYMSVSEVSFILGPIVLVSLYLVGPELSEAMVRNKEYNELFKHMNVVGRLLNDVQTFKKESCQGKVNSVTVQDLCNGGDGSPASLEAANGEIRRVIDASRWELRRLVVREGGVVPRPCKELFWHMSKAVSLFYLEKDAYLLPEDMMAAAKAVVLEPLQLHCQ